MQHFKKITYLIFAITLELLLNNLLFSMESHEGCIVRKPLLNRPIKVKKNFQSNLELTGEPEIEKSLPLEGRITELIKLIEAILNCFDFSQHHTSIQRSLNKTKIILERDINQANAMTLLKKAKNKLKKNIEHSQKKEATLEVHVNILLPIKKLNYIILKINQILQS